MTLKKTAKTPEENTVSEMALTIQELIRKSKNVDWAHEAKEYCEAAAAAAEAMYILSEKGLA